MKSILDRKMSFFNKLFGGGDEPKKAAAPPAPTKSEAEKIAEKKIKIEAALNDLDVKIKTFEEKEKKFDLQNFLKLQRQKSEDSVYRIQKECWCLKQLHHTDRTSSIRPVH